MRELLEAKPLITLKISFLLRMKIAENFLKRSEFLILKFTAMNDKPISPNRTGRGYSTSQNPDSKKETRRRDWGYTDHYRRMMQRDSRGIKSSEFEEEQ